MKKSLSIVFLIFVGFGMIRTNEPVQSGDDLEMHINVINDQNIDYDDVHISMLIYDLGESIYSSSFELQDNEKQGKWLFWDTTGIEPGYYLARIVISDGNFRQVKHRYLSVI